MKKTFMGVRLKRLREEQRLTQAALAGKLGISLSYLNQLENNQRPLTLPVLLALNSVFGLDVQSFAEGDEARLISDLREALADPSLGELIATAELRELALNMPAVGRALVNLNRKYRHAAEQYAAISARLGEDRQAGRGHSAVHAIRGSPGLLLPAAQLHCRTRRSGGSDRRTGWNFRSGGWRRPWWRISKDLHGVKVMIDALDELGSGTQRLFDARTRTLRLSRSFAVRANRPFSSRRKSGFWNWMKRYVRSSARQILPATNCAASRGSGLRTILRER